MQNAKQQNFLAFPSHLSPGSAQFYFMEEQKMEIMQRFGMYNI